MIDKYGGVWKYRVMGKYRGVWKYWVQIWEWVIMVAMLAQVDDTRGLRDGSHEVNAS